jgi:DNA-binding MarR family transcriptional regulator
VTATSDPRLLVLHGLRLKAIASVADIAEVAGLHVDRVAAELDGLVDDELVAHRTGKLTGWSLTTQGRAEHERLVAAQLDEARERSTVHDAYERFLGLNPRLLEVCTRWQVREVGGVPQVNDHLDARHDAAVVAELGAIHAELLTILAGLEQAIDRFARYRPALDAALAAVRAGDVDMLAKPMVPSYHTIWFELHEDLLTTLSLERSSETV